MKLTKQECDEISRMHVKAAFPIPDQIIIKIDHPDVGRVIFFSVNKALLADNNLA